MLRFERRVVASLTESADPDTRAAVERWVETTLAVMPEHLRAGVVAQSLALGAWTSLRRRRPEAVVASLRDSPVGLVRQYERLLGSLVRFAEHELAGRTT